MAKAQRLPASKKADPSITTFGVCAACDPRIDKESRDRTANIIETIADLIATHVKMPDGTPVKVVWTPVLIDGEEQADIVARQFKESGVGAIVCTPDTVTRTQAVAVFIQYIQANPQYVSEPPIDAIFRALIDKWPCPE